MEQTTETLLEMARTALRTARSLPVGPDRDELRQIAMALRSLAKRNHQRAGVAMPDVRSPGIAAERAAD